VNTSRKLGVVLLLLAGAILRPSASRAENTLGDLDALMKKAEEGKGEGLPGYKAQIDLESVEDGESRRRVMTIRVGMVEGRSNNGLVEFLSPPSARGQRMLVVQRNMWFLSPNVSKPVPISPRQRLLGEASFGDVASTNYVGDYGPSLVREESLGGDDCWVLELKALYKNVTYDRILYWVSKSRGLGVKAEFYTLSGKKLKNAEFRYENTVRHEGRSRPFISEMIITDDLDPTRRVTMKFNDVAVAKYQALDFDLNALVR
jgi:hypothetical protein